MHFLSAHILWIGGHTLACVSLNTFRTCLWLSIPAVYAIYVHTPSRTTRKKKPQHTPRLTTNKQDNNAANDPFHIVAVPLSWFSKLRYRYPAACIMSCVVVGVCQFCAQSPSSCEYINVIANTHTRGKGETTNMLMRMSTNLTVSDLANIIHSRGLNPLHMRRNAQNKPHSTSHCARREKECV